MSFMKATLFKSILILGDLVVLVLGLYIAAYITDKSFYTNINEFINGYDELIWILVSNAWFFININGLLALGKISLTHLFIGTCVTIMQITIITGIGSYLIYPDTFSGKLFVVMAMTQFVMITGWKYLFWQYDVSTYLSSHLLIIGPEEFCEELKEKFSQCQGLMCQAAYWQYSEVTGLPSESMLNKYDSVLISSKLELEAMKSLVLLAHKLRLSTAIVPNFFDLYWTNAELDRLDDMPVFRLKSIQPTVTMLKSKRVMDCILAGVGLILCLPVFVIIAILIKLDSPGAVIYTQIRCGEDEKLFKIYKFRSMVNDAEKGTGAVLCCQKDDRITKFGKFLRVTRIDELPQLFNVFIGNMSLVGPRPERPEFVEKFKENIPYYTARHSVKPGITGLAQIKGKYNTSVQDKLIYDLLYIHSYSTVYDIVIILQTVKVLLMKESTQGVKEKQHKSNMDMVCMSIDERSQV